MRDAGTTRQLADSFDITRLRPHPLRCLVRVMRPDDTTEGGLVIPDIGAGTWTGAPAPSLRRWCGEVVRCGASPEWDGVEIGDVVVWDKYTIHEFVHRGDTYAVMDPTQMMAVIDRSMAGGRQDKDVRGSWDPEREG